MLAAAVRVSASLPGAAPAEPQPRGLDRASHVLALLKYLSRFRQSAYLELAPPGQHRASAHHKRPRALAHPRAAHQRGSQPRCAGRPRGPLDGVATVRRAVASTQMARMTRATRMNRTLRQLPARARRPGSAGNRCPSTGQRRRSESAPRAAPPIHAADSSGAWCGGAGLGGSNEHLGGREGNI